MTADERLTELEVHVTHQDAVIATLDEVIREFAGRVQLLERLVEDLKQARSASPSGRADEPPPHY